MRVITFSRFFPAYHPKCGEPTFFVEQILNGIAEKVEGNGLVDRDKLLPGVKEIVNDFFLLCSKEAVKSHTIRAGNRWKAGDKFSPRVWSGKPYQSKQIQFAPDIEIKKIWDFEMDKNGVYSVSGIYLDTGTYGTLAKNDGLTEEEMFHWFMPNYDKPKAFSGQIICWDQQINY